MKDFVSKPYKPNFFAVDESSVLHKTLVKKVIAKRGSKPVLKTIHQYQGVTVIGAIDGTGRVVYQLHQKAANASKFAYFLRFLRGQRTRHQIHVILDNASFHRCETTRELARNLSINLHFQVAHSPFLNAAEDIWRQLKEFLRGRFFKTLNNLQAGIEMFFQNHPKLNINLVKYLS